MEDDMGKSKAIDDAIEQLRGIIHSIKLERKVYCDICKQSCNATKGDFIVNEYATLNAVWGFYSEKYGERHECIMCEECYNKIVDFIKTLGGKINKTIILE